MPYSARISYCRNFKKVSVGGERPFYAAIPDPEVRGRRRDLYFIFSPSAVLSCHSISVAMESSAWECLEDSENCFFFQNVRANKFAKKRIYTVSQKTRHPTLAHNFAKYLSIFNFFFTDGLSSKFTTNSFLNIPPCLKRVAILPCEIWMSEKMASIWNMYCN